MSTMAVRISSTIRKANELAERQRRGPVPTEELYDFQRVKVELLRDCLRANELASDEARETLAAAVVRLGELGEQLAAERGEAPRASA